jgi:hypothetical protein
MALVRRLERKPLDRDAAHTTVECTYSIVQAEDGSRLLQIDTYGSAERRIVGKKSQSIRLTPEAIVQLKQIIESEL